MTRSPADAETACLSEPSQRDEEEAHAAGTVPGADGPVVPWGRLLALIAPHYPKVGPKGGRPPMPLEVMLRVYFLQNGYALSDPMAEGSSVKQSIQWIDCSEQRSMTARRCAGLPGSSWAVTASRTRPPSSLPPPAGAARADASDLRRGQHASFPRRAAALSSQMSQRIHKTSGMGLGRTIA